MKYTCLILFAIVFFSCSKKSNSANPVTPLIIGNDYGCISRAFVARNTYTLTSSDSLYAMSLFNSNGLSDDGLRLIRVNYDTIGSRHFVFAAVQQYINGLPVFTNMYNYTFINGNIDNIDGSKNTTTLNATPALTLSQVRWLYVRNLPTKPFDFSSYKDSCLTAVLGYYNTNINNGPSAPVKLEKVWVVQPERSSYPVAIFKEDGTLMDFNTGIVYASL